MALTKKLYSNRDTKRYYDTTVEFYANGKYGKEYSFDLSNLIHTPTFRRLSAKTQLLPDLENDYFRNRLTHTLEVSDIAIKIAKKINAEHPFFKLQNSVNLNLIRFAAHAHDIGHPPFGHKGEKALDKMMIKFANEFKKYVYHQNLEKNISKEDYGLRFEGNAFNIRLLVALEKMFVDNDNEYIRKYIGINPTFRSIASILKYNSLLSDEEVEIKEQDGKSSLYFKKVKNKKGYFKEDEDLIKKVIENVTGEKSFKGRFRTIECNIMEFADDISYTIYDLEDVLKGRFITFEDLTKKYLLDENFTSLKMIYNEVKEDFMEALKYDSLKSTPKISFPTDEIKFIEFIENEFLNIFFTPAAKKKYKSSSVLGYVFTKEVAKNGFSRQSVTSLLVEYFISRIIVEDIAEIPALTKVKMDTKAFILMCFLKRFVFNSITGKSKIQIVDYRGGEIVETIFKTLYENPNLLPDDYKEVYDSLTESALKNGSNFVQKCNEAKVLIPEQVRCICNYIACMTNRYAIEFYARLKSENHQSIFKPF
jgi:dGTPase